MEKNVKKCDIKMLLMNIKSKYILMKIFDNIKKRKVLNIIQYNKNIQNRLEFTIKDYIELAKIEIEIIAYKYEYGPFFNFNKELSSFYHEYCDDCKEEKLYKRLPFYDEDSNLKKKHSL